MANRTPKGTVNLGVIKAIFEGGNPPLNKKVLWFDTIVRLHKVYNLSTETWEPLGDSNTYTKQEVDDLISQALGSITPNGIFVEDEVSATSGMISAGTVTVGLSQPIRPQLEKSVFYNGVFIPKSMYSIANNQAVINLGLLGIDPKVGDFIVIKYYK